GRVVVVVGAGWVVVVVAAGWVVVVVVVVVVGACAGAGLRSTDTSFEKRLAVTRSVRPSPFTSPMASETLAEPPVGNGEPDAGVKAPVPSPRRTDTLSELWLTATASTWPSPSTSPSATASGPSPPVGTGGPAAVKVGWAAPSPSSTEMSPV